MNDYQFPQRTSRNSQQNSPYIKPNKINFSNSSNKYCNKNDYYNDNDDNEYDNQDNKYSCHKNDYNSNNDYNDNNDYNVNKDYNDNNDYNNNHYNDNNDYNNNHYNNEDTGYINLNLINYNKNSKAPKKQKKLESMINLEDFIFLEEKLNEIIYSLKNGIIIKNQCLDFWNYFYENNLYEKIEKTFSGEDDTGIIKSSLNYALLSIMLCYEFSFDRNVLIKAHILLLEILELNHRSIILYCENILNKISLDNQENVWVLKLYEIVQLSKIEDKKYYIENSSYPERIRINSEKIDKKLRNILVNYKTEYSLYIKSLLNKKTMKNYEEINDFFNEYILRMEKNLPNEQLNSECKAIRPPYILSPRTKPYTLVLSLDETLVNFQQMNYTQGILKLRPYLLEFLEQVSIYYELVLFTTESQQYVEPIIKAIEQRKKYFDYIFYKENCIMIGNDYVKDLSRIGRPLDSTIIVDNVSQHFRFQKENGITIKSFWAKDPGDKALYNLIPILINIAEEEIDVRDGIAKYKNEINMKVSNPKNYI
jgi:Dullard-like phosphatase family protein